ncbi:peptidase S9 prolyl oligopeptidase active site domain protein (plasmid) [Deinococcus proteolyticus MRP]|uniref:Peptidase S9 prolyl oligopeptidase active site domain protein n=1 Tax=Deinococcus proteolyticus (strain ATCC 35074 / DSM 20540 / JCM 6276 / NBRC 101906 / NCIMB 13154 / VKM Ac-1939 / CCM 2703 / MRP) TaxID=693977 RepID=F0RQF5_DEIPM|nr:peptidase S9 prolyl oligopeptidase active site domain protein [Deinococcus proteolyticus MRP]
MEAAFPPWLPTSLRWLISYQGFLDGHDRVRMFFPDLLESEIPLDRQVQSDNTQYESCEWTYSV